MLLGALDVAVNKGERCWNPFALIFLNIFYVLHAAENNYFNRPTQADHSGRAVCGMNCLQTLGSWVRIPLEAWMSVCVYSMFMFCVQV
jgi:hypothetical protein